MAVATFANSKGGSGKTTSALLLASALAQRVPTAIIDADPRRPVASWLKKTQVAGLVPANLTVVSNITEDNIIETIDDLKTKNSFVICDLEGLASKLMAYAISRSDFIVIPCKEQQQDAEAAVAVIQAMKRDFQMLGRSVPYALLFTMTKYVKSRSSRIIIEQFRNSPIPVFKTEITERDPYSQIFIRGGTIYDLSNSLNIDKAVSEVDAFTMEAVEHFRAVKTAAA